MLLLGCSFYITAPLPVNIQLEITSNVPRGCPPLSSPLKAWAIKIKHLLLLLPLIRPVEVFTYRGSSVHTRFLVRTSSVYSFLCTPRLIWRWLIQSWPQMKGVVICHCVYWADYLSDYKRACQRLRLVVGLDTSWRQCHSAEHAVTVQHTSSSLLRWETGGKRSSPTFHLLWW